MTNSMGTSAMHSSGLMCFPGGDPAPVSNLREQVRGDLIATMTRVAAQRGYIALSLSAVRQLADQVIARADATRTDRPDFDCMGIEQLLLDDRGWSVVNTFLEKIGFGK